MSKSNKDNLFLQWWLLNLVVLVISAVCFKLGLFHEIWKKDSSYLCFVIMLIYVFASGMNGVLCHRKLFDEKHLDTGWFISEFCLSLGMIGTVIGFIQMLSGFAVMDGGASKSIQNIIVSMSYGMSTALYTTLAGLIFGNLIKLQCFKMDLCLGDMKKGKNDQ